MTKKEALDDFGFIMTCLKHTADKLPRPNFEEVAKETGAKTANAWSVKSSIYHRHWLIMKKWGLAGNSGNRKKLIAATATTALVTVKKRVKSTMKKLATNMDGDGDEDSSDGDESFVKRAKNAKMTKVEKNGEEAEKSEGENEPDELG